MTIILVCFFVGVLYCIVCHSFLSYNLLGCQFGGSAVSSTSTVVIEFDDFQSKTTGSWSRKTTVFRENAWKASPSCFSCIFSFPPPYFSIFFFFPVVIYPSTSPVSHALHLFLSSSVCQLVISLEAWFVSKSSCFRQEKVMPRYQDEGKKQQDSVSPGSGEKTEINKDQDILTAKGCEWEEVWLERKGKMTKRWP